MRHAVSGLLIARNRVETPSNVQRTRSLSQAPDGRLPGMADIFLPKRTGEPSRFGTTHWSLVLTAGEHRGVESEQALSELCEAYWYPIYAYVRRRTASVHQAQDLTQAFFQRLLEQQSIAAADPERGRFRAFLITACRRFLVNEWHKEHAAKRGGGVCLLSLDLQAGESRYAVEPADAETPEQLFERQWALTLLARVLDALRQEHVAKGKAEYFEVLKPFLSGAGGRYDEAAAKLGVSTGAVKVAAHRLRSRFRELLRSEIAGTLQNPQDVDDEIRQLFTVLGG